MSRKAFDIGDVPRIKATFTDPDTGDYLDPTTLVISVKDPAEAETVYAYGVDAALQRSSAGIYTVDHPVDMAGDWRWKITATGVAASVEEGTFAVRRSSY